MPLTQTKFYTEEDYYRLPEDIRAELIEGNLIYNQAAPSRIHQTILSELHTIINNYIKAKSGNCRIYPAPFAVRLKKGNTIVDPLKESIFVYYLEQEHFKAEAYTFRDKIKVNIYEDLFIDFAGLDL